MIAGFERYYQIARAFRDEDLRADRQPEHTQIDLEMSFIEEADIQDVVEGDVSPRLRRSTGRRLCRLPFPRLTYAEAMARFGSDKPDVRFGMEIVDVSDLAGEGGVPGLHRRRRRGWRGPRAEGGGRSGASRARTSTTWRPRWRSSERRGLARLGRGGRRAVAHRQVRRARDHGSPSWLGWGRTRRSPSVPGRPSPGGGAESRRPSSCRWPSGWAWSGTDGPSSGSSTSRCSNTTRGKGGSRPSTTRSPMPRLDTRGGPAEKPLELGTYAYDLVLNGVELGSGSIRIADPALQEAVFAALGLERGADRRPSSASWWKRWTTAYRRTEAWPWAWTASVMLMAGESSIRDVIAFPKTQSGSCPLTGAPSPVAADQLKELRLRSS